MSVKTQMTALADAIRSKSGATGKLSISGMTDAVNSISSSGEGGGSVDYYKCAMVHSSPTEEVLRVEGAGDDSVNGEYRRIGEMRWKHVSNLRYCYYYERTNPDGYPRPFDRGWFIASLPGLGFESALYYNSSVTGSYGRCYKHNLSTGENEYNAPEPSPTVTIETVEIDPETLNTWDGYKATWNTNLNYFTFSGELTYGFRYGDYFVPEVGKIYPADTRAIVERLWTRGADSGDVVNSCNEYYKCAAVYGPRRVTGFIVSGAGTEAVNGNYLLTDLKTEEDTPIYKHETAAYYYFEMWGEKGICTSPTDYPGNGLYYNMYDEGWFPGSGGAEPAPTVTAGNIILDANIPKTWDGYRVQKDSSGAFSVSETLIKGLVYSRLTPAVGRVYSEDGLFKPSYFRQSRSGELLMIPLVSNEQNADTGQELKTVDDVRLDCESFRFGRRVSDVSAPLSYNENTLTVTTWIKSSSSAILFSLRNESMEINFEYYSNKVVSATGEDRAEVYAPEGIEIGDLGDRWAHFSVVLLPDKIKVYVNEKYWGETELYASAKNQYYTSAHVHTTHRLVSDGPHWVKDFRVYNRELSATEISEIRKENDPEK